MNESQLHWVFGYGSLIFRIDFPYLEARAASIKGWERRFWQGSHDHRGVPDAPGRVVTLIEAPGVVCEGVAYLISAEVFEHLDYREKNGYQRLETQIDFAEGCSETGIVYVADPSNHAFLGPASLEEIADHVVASKGPSGTNADYLLSLAAAFRERAINDSHVFQLEALVRARLG